MSFSEKPASAFPDMCGCGVDAISRRRCPGKPEACGPPPRHGRTQAFMLSCAMLQNAIERIQNRFGLALTSATDWALAAAILVGAAIIALLLHAALLWLARRVMGERQTFLRTVLAATKGPTRLGLLLIALAIALPMTALPTAIASVVARVLTLATICLLGWIALTALHIGADLHLRRFRLDLADNL